MNRTEVGRATIEAACVAGLVIGVLLVWRLRIDGPAHRFPSFGAGDLFGLFLPAYSYEAERLRGLELPFWNPYQAGGQPFLATLQPGALYPARALLLVTDSATAMQWSTIAHVLLSCLAMYALCRVLGARPAGAVAGAAVFTTASALPLLFAPTFLEAGAWLPVASLALVRVVRDERGRPWVLALGAAGAMPVLAGGHQAAVYVAYGLALLGVALLADRRRRGHLSAPAAAGRLALAGLLALGLCAPQVLPTLYWTRETVRPLGQLTDAQIMPYWAPSLTWSAAWQVVRQTFAGWGGLQALYLSAPAVALAMVGFCVTGTYGAVLGLGTLVAYLLAMGPGTPWFVLYHWLPGLAIFRLPTRLFLLVTFLCALGAAHGLTALARARPFRRSSRRWVELAALGLVLVVLVGPLHNDDHLPWTLPPSHLTPSVSLFAAAARATADGRAALPGDRLDLGFGVFVRQGTLHRVLVLQDFDSMSSRRLAAYLSAVAGEAPPSPDAPLPFMGSLPLSRIARPELLDLVAVRSIVLPLDADRPPASPRWVLVDRAPRYGVYSNPDALPRSYVVTRARVVDKEPAALDGILAPGFDRYQEAVLVGRPDAPELRALAEAPGTPFRPARILADAPERVIVQAVADQPSLLVVADTFAPGWTARVDGQPARLWQTNYYVRGVLLQAGEHEVELRYRAPGFAAGVAVAAVALTVAVAAVGRRRAGTAPPPTVNQR